MFELKRSAFLRLGGNRTAARRFAFLASFMRLCAVLSFTLGFLSLLPQTGAALRALPLTGKIWSAGDGIVPAAVLAVCGAAYALCGQTFSFALCALLSGTGRTRRPQLAGLLRPVNGFRFLMLRLERAAAVARILLVCLLPSAVTAVLLYCLLTIGIPAILFQAGLCLFCLQLFSGLIAAAILKERFRLTPYLLCTNPMLSVSDALVSSALLTENKTLRLWILRLGTLPLHLAANPFLPLLCAHAYRAAFAAAVSEKLYGERKIEDRDAGIVFYINKATVMRTQTKPTESEKLY